MAHQYRTFQKSCLPFRGPATSLGMVHSSWEVFLSVLLVSHSPKVKRGDPNQIKVYKGRFVGKQISVGYTGLKARGVSMERETEGRGKRKRERECTFWERENAESEGKETKMSGLYKKEHWGRGSPGRVLESSG